MALVPQFSIGSRRSAAAAVAVIFLFVGSDVHASTVTFARFRELGQTQESQPENTDGAETMRDDHQVSPDLLGNPRSPLPSVNLTPNTLGPNLVTSVVLPEPDPRTALGYLVGVVGAWELLRRFRRAWTAVGGAEL